MLILEKNHATFLVYVCIAQYTAYRIPYPGENIKVKEMKVWKRGKVLKKCRQSMEKCGIRLRFGTFVGKLGGKISLTSCLKNGVKK